MESKEKYRDIIHAQRPPVPEGHPRMSILNRAKIFSPFAALRGYDEKINEQDEKSLWTARVELAEEVQENIGRRLSNLQKNSQIAVTHFVTVTGDPVFSGNHSFNISDTVRNSANISASDSSSADIGTYRTTVGLLLSIDFTARTLRIRDKSVRYETDGFAKETYTDIRFEDILSVQSGTPHQSTQSDTPN